MIVLSDYQIYEKSQVRVLNTDYALCRNIQTNDKKLLVKGDFHQFSGIKAINEQTVLCELNTENAEALRQIMPWLNPVPLGLSKTFGFGDRLGLATPGHILAAESHQVNPIYAQQSVRENTRTGRSAQTVMDEAMWGVFQAGWRQPWGADADHIKIPEALDGFIKAGFSMFTIDPGDHVDQYADGYSLDVIRAKLDVFPWAQLSTDKNSFSRDWLGKEIPSLGLIFDEKTLLKALVKYGKAIAHTAMLFVEIVKIKGGTPFDFEVSVDETDTPTTVAEHYFIASELKRLGVRWTSLAPRFIGRFEKGVDYIGDLQEFDHSIRLHAEVAKFFGDYKISLHSGSDKFSVYPSINHYTNGKLHVKTAGTSYLEALRVVAEVSPEFFKEILTFARNRYEIDKATYHVSAVLGNVPEAPPEPMMLLDQFDARQVFHVTYGSVLDKYHSELFRILRSNEQRYYAVLKQHFNHHLDLLS